MFVLTKLLSFLPMGNMLRGTSGKLIIIIGAIAGLAFLAWQWKDSIQEAVYNEIYAEQAQAALEDKERRLETIRQVNERNRELQNQLDEKNRQLSKSFDKAERKIRDAPEDDDGQVSKILRDAIQFIGDRDLSSFDNNSAEETEDKEKTDTDNPWIKEWQEREKGNE